MTEFPVVQINGYANVQSGYSFKSSDWLDDGVPVVKIANVKDGRVDRTGLGFVSETVAAQAAKFSLSEGDVLLAMTGYVGEMAVVKESDLPLLLNQRVGRCLPVSPLLDKRFMYYALSSSNGRLQLENLGQGSAQANLSAGDFGLVEIPLPPLAEQRAIAGVLGAIDDKIEANRRIVKTAREFIDALFCTAFSDGEINVQLSSLAEVVDCLHTKKPDQALEGKQLLQLSNISDDGFLILGNHYPISLDDYNKWTANIEATEGDVILTNVGRVGALARLPKGVKAALGRNMTAIRARKPSDALFIFAALNNAQVRRGMKSLIDVGTIMDALNVHAIRRILLPESTVQQRDGFASAVGDLVERAEVAVKESGGLRSLRDTLVPELLSGRLRVKDAESMMENV